MKAKEFIKTTKGKIILGVAAAILLLIVFSQYPTSEEKVLEEYKRYYDVTVFEKYYDGKGLFGWLEKKKKSKVLDMAMDELQKGIMATTGGSPQDIDNVEITKVNIANRSSKSKYVDIETTVKNNSSKSISYIKINLYFKDSTGSIIYSDWTNDSSTIKPGASQTISKMVDKEGWEVVSAEIDDIRFK